MTASVVKAVLHADPLPWLLASDEPYARWVTLAQVMGRPAEETDVVQAHAQVLADPGVRSLARGLPQWGQGAASADDDQTYLPNRLSLLADMGVGAGDIAEVERALDAFLAHRDDGGRFESSGRIPHGEPVESGAQQCDTNVIADVLLRFGRGDDERVVAALSRIEKDATRTPQGRAWRCIQEKRGLWRGPGRKADVCPQVTLEGLRAFSHVPPERRPTWLADAARTPLEVWRRRASERPYSFGHGYQFKSVKWPNYWYDVLWVVETVGRFPEVWEGPHAQEQDRQALAELAACLIAYNFDEHGRVVPRRVHRGFERFSFGQKKRPSPFATARALVALERLSDLAEETSRVDVSALSSSKGGRGTAVPPKGAPAPCPVPSAPIAYPARSAVARPLARHHIGTPWVPASVGSVVADIIGINATLPTEPYVALFSRLPAMSKSRLDSALYEQRSLVRLRCMRGNVMVVRRDRIAMLFAATRRQTTRYARTYAEFRGVTDAVFDRLAPQVLELTAAEPLTTGQLRERMADTRGVDVAALVSRMSTECLLVRGRPTGGWTDRHWTYVPFAQAFPEVDLDAFAEEEADVALVRAYMRAFGPASSKDVSWWTGVGARRTGRALAALGDEIVDVRLAKDHDGEYLMHAADLDELPSVSMPASPSAVFLPALDPLVMGYAHKDRLVADEHRRFVFDRSGGVTSTVLLDGHVAAVWDVREEPEPAVLLAPLHDLGADARAALDARAAELGAFWFEAETPVEWLAGVPSLADRPAGALFRPLR